MCGIAGFSNHRINFLSKKDKWNHILGRMNNIQKHRGPDGEGENLLEHCGLAQVRLAIIDLKTGTQPMTRRGGRGDYTIVFNGEIYNMLSLKKELIKKGYLFQTTSDTEVVLQGFIEEGVAFIQKLNGIFAFAIWSHRDEVLTLVRDRVGIKPLFYTMKQNTIVFSSEIKGIFQFPEIEAVLDKEGISEVFGLGPAKTYGKGVFKGVEEVLPGYYYQYSKEGLRLVNYWKLKSAVHTDTFEETVEKTRYLLTDSIKKQMLSDVPLCTFLSGGIDSSLVTAICSEELKKEGKVLDTFSFDFAGNEKNFKANSFQPSQDRPFVDKMVEYAGTNHRYLECDKEALFYGLEKAVDGRDLPCMADVESSLLYFCGLVAKTNKVTLTGECADEIFGGYPWFYKKDCFESDTFPWARDFTLRTVLLKEELVSELELESYARGAYEKTVKQTPILEGEVGEEKRRRELAYLNMKWFMQTLLDRMDRTSMSVGLEARVPFADHRLIEYVFNVPWEMKFYGKLSKGLLRKAGEAYLPNEVLYRAKSPYPKTYDPEYEQLIKGRMREILDDTNAPILQFIDMKKVERFMSAKTEYGRPFYGQLMAGPQLLAYMIQVNYWLEKYKIRVL